MGQILSRGIWECSVWEQLLFKPGAGGSMKIPTPSRVFPTSKACPGFREQSYSHFPLIYGSGLIPEFLGGGVGMIYSREAAAGWRFDPVTGGKCPRPSFSQGLWLSSKHSKRFMWEFRAAADRQPRELQIPGKRRSHTRIPSKEGHLWL